MARKLKENERIVPYEKASLRDMSGRPGPVFQSYIIVDTTDAPETAETLKPDEWLEKIGQVTERNPDRSFLPARLLYRKVHESEIDTKTKRSTGENELLDSLVPLFAEMYKAHITRSEVENTGNVKTIKRPAPKNKPNTKDRIRETVKLAQKLLSDPQQMERYREWHLQEYGCLPEEK